NWRATAGLYGDHLGTCPCLDPSQLLHFLERFPHPDQPDSTAGGIENRVRQTPAHLFRDFVPHGFLAFDAKWLLESRNVKPTLLVLALCDHSSAIADQSIDQR